MVTRNRGRDTASASPLSRLIESRLGRTVASLTAVLLASATLVAGVGLAPAAADANLTLTATTAGTVLAGENATVTLTANNISAGDLFNLSFRYQLPSGITYVAGSSSPSSIGDPTIITVTDSVSPLVTHQVLIWSNAADLPIGDEVDLSFGVAASTAAYPVGGTFTGIAGAYAQSDPRLVPKFTSGGDPVGGSYTASATYTPPTTTVSALRVTKSDPEPEHELMRGVHNNTTLYTIKVDDTAVSSTTGVIVDDYLPAGLEFLGCGATDNAAAGHIEYPGAPRLTATPAVSACVVPASVDTLTNPTGLPAGVYTHVTWNLGTLAAGASKTITYRAAIPLRANTATFAGATPTAASLGQASNLDNNTGAETRQVGGGQSYTNTVTASGTYTGTVASGASTTVTATASDTVKSMDLSVVKSTSTPSFAAGSIASFGMLVRTSEYTSSSGVKLTDVIPDGLCPLLPAGTPVLGSVPVPADCTDTGTVSNATVDSVTPNSDGTFTVIFTPTVSTAAGASFTIGYTALDRANYAGSGDPTSAGDLFTNTVTIAGTTTVIAPLAPDVSRSVTDDSSATQTSSAPTISKKILPRTPVASAAACAGQAGNYVASPPTTPSAFRLGDRVCFELTVNFSGTAETRNARVTDFVPVGTSYEGYAVGSQSTVAASEVAAPTGGTVPTWKIGHTVGGSSALFVDKGQTLVLYVSALVTTVSSSTSTVDITANLMKYRQENTSGTVFALRDSANFGIAPAATASLAKVITAVNSAPKSPVVTTTGAVEGTTVDFSLTVKNTGSAANNNNFPIDGADIWDALPLGVACTTISLISAGGTCADNATGANTPSRITWNLTGTIPAGSTATAVTYRVTVPAQVSVSSTLTNSASIVHFVAPNTAGGESDFYPTNSLDTANTANWNTTAANAAASITTPDAVVVKTGSTNITDTNNSAAGQAVAGETVNYDYSVTIPAHTTAFNGVLSDALPAGISIVASTLITADIPGSSGLTAATVPPGYTLSATGTLTLPATLDNTTAAAQVFTVHIANALVGPGATTGNKVNTATFRSNLTLGGTAITPRTATKTIVVVAPTPTLAKTASPATANANDTVTYTVTAKNGASSPNGYDTVVLDCLPAGITFVAYTTVPGSVTTNTPVAGNVSNGCASGQTVVSWTIGTLAPSASIAVVFTGTVDPIAAGLNTYTNTASVTTSTLNNGLRDNTVEGVLSASASATTTVAGAPTTKTVDRTVATIGETANYTLGVTIPANVNFYQASIIDTFPAGMSASAATVTCLTLPAPGADCTADLTGGGSALTPVGGKIGWSLGDITAKSYDRVVSVTYAATVSDVVGNARNTALSNTALLAWDLTNKPTNPTAANATFDKAGAASTPAVVTVQEPTVSLAKVVDDTTPEPGQVFGYTVTATNTNVTNSSTAYGVKVTDAVPTGVIVDPTSLANGTIAGQTANGGGTITWTLPTSLAPGASVTLTYSAKLAPSATLTAAALTNTAKVTTYTSLPGAGRTYGTTAQNTSSATVTPTFPSVSVAKAVAAGTVAYAGSSFGWKVTYTNAPTAGSATSVTPNDVLPKNWTYDTNSAFVSVAGAAATQVEPTITTTAGVQTLTWPAFGPLAASKTIVITYSATPGTAALTDAGAGSTHLHSNTASATTTDATGATANAAGSYTGGGATANATINAADLSIVKAAGGALVAGRNTTNGWTLTVSNKAGSDTAVGPFIVTDTPSTLPAGISIESASGIGWTCTTPDPTTFVFSCARTNANDTLAAGASFAVINMKVDVAANVADGTTATNAAHVAARTFDPALENNDSSKTLTVSASADLKIVKAVSGAVKSGQTVTWTLDVTNLGPSVSAAPVTVTDTLPSGVTNVTVSGAGWTCGAVTATVTCTLAGALAVGSAPQLVVTGTVASSFTGNVVNSATVNPTTTDPVSSNNSSTTTTAADSATTLAFAKSLTSGTMVPGATSTYRFDVTNTGTADARGVSFTDALPSGLTYAGGVTSIAGSWTCSETGTSPSTVTCTLAGGVSAASGSNTASVSFVVNVPSGLVGGVTNTARVSSTNAPSVDATTSGTPIGSADLRITKTHPAGAVFAGNSLTYTIGTRNAGPSDTGGPLVVVDTVPTGMTPTAASGTGWTCAISGPVVTCTSVTGLTNGQSAAAIGVTVSIDPAAGPATLTNTATVSGPLDDPTPGNNIAHDPTDVTSSADVSIAKSGPATVTAGDDVSYTLTVANAGPSEATAASVVDALPSGLTPVSIAGAGWTCSVATFSCGPRTLPVGTSTITVVAHVGADVADGSSLTNSATVTSQDTAGIHDDTATSTATVNAVADLELTKTAATPTVTAGSQTSFTFTLKNHGPSDAVAPITITDTLPAGMSYVGSTGTWDCLPDAVDPSSVVCTLQGIDSLPVGGTAPTLQLEVQLASSLPTGDLTNTATAATPTTEAIGSNPTGDATVTVGDSADLAIVKTLTTAVRIGDRSTFSLAVHNSGPSDASAVSVEDVLVPSLTEIDISAVDPAWTCVIGVATASGTPVDCDLTDPLVSGGDAPAIVLSATVTAAGYPSFDNTATVNSTTPDPESTNNSSTITVDVPAQVALSVTKTHLDQLVQGTTARYRITVGNSGPTELPAGFQVIDQLPRGLSFVSASGTDVTCVAVAKKVTCTFIQPLAVGALASVVLTVMVATDAPTTITNVAAISTPVENLDPTNSTATDVAQVHAPKADGALAFTGTSTPVGDVLTLAAGLLAFGLLLMLVGQTRRRRRLS